MAKRKYDQGKAGFNRGKDRIIQNDWGSCRYNGFHHPSMGQDTYTVPELEDKCESVNFMSVPDQHNYCSYIYHVPNSNKSVEVCKWDWWDKMSAPTEEF